MLRPLALPDLVVTQVTGLTLDLEPLPAAEHGANQEYYQGEADAESGYEEVVDPCPGAYQVMLLSKYFCVK